MQCIKCGRDDDGFICKHCLSKGASTMGNLMKKVGGSVLKVAPIGIFFINRVKGKSDE